MTKESDSLRDSEGVKYVKITSLGHPEKFESAEGFMLITEDTAKSEPSLSPAKALDREAREFLAGMKIAKPEPVNVKLGDAAPVFGPAK